MSTCWALVEQDRERILAANGRGEKVKHWQPLRYWHRLRSALVESETPPLTIIVREWCFVSMTVEWMDPAGKRAMRDAATALQSVAASMVGLYPVDHVDEPQGS